MKHFIGNVSIKHVYMNTFSPHLFWRMPPPLAFPWFPITLTTILVVIKGAYGLFDMKAGDIKHLFSRKHIHFLISEHVNSQT